MAECFLGVNQTWPSLLAALISSACADFSFCEPEGHVFLQHENRVRHRQGHTRPVGSAKAKCINSVNAKKLF